MTPNDDLPRKRWSALELTVSAITTCYITNASPLMLPFQATTLSSINKTLDGYLVTHPKSLFSHTPFIAVSMLCPSSVFRHAIMNASRPLLVARHLWRLEAKSVASQEALESFFAACGPRSFLYRWTIAVFPPLCHSQWSVLFWLNPQATSVEMRNHLFLCIPHLLKTSVYPVLHLMNRL